MSRFQFVADHRDTFEVKWLCEVIEISRSSFYDWLAAAPARAERAAADDALAVRIAAVHEADKTYGAPRITAELNDGTIIGDDGRVNHKRVARVMRARGIAGLRLRRKVCTTIPEPADTPVPDLLERDFTAPVPNVKYVGDITYLPFGDGHTTGNLYLATVIDCFSRRLVGWSIASHMRTELVEDALRAVQRERGSLAGAVFHADHGAQYTARDFAALCNDLGVIRSMGAVGSSADNALAESFHATLKRETFARRRPLGDRRRRPARRVPVGHPLQHPPTALVVRPDQPDQLREHALRRYAANRRVTIDRVSTSRGEGPASRAGVTGRGLDTSATTPALASPREQCASC